MLVLSVALGWGLELLVDWTGGALTSAYDRLGAAPGAARSLSVFEESLAGFNGSHAMHVVLGVGFVVAVVATGTVASAVSVGVHRRKLKRERRVSNRAGRLRGVGASGLGLALVTCCSVGVLASAARAGSAAPLALLPLVEGWVVVVAGLLGAWLLLQGVLRHRDEGVREGAHDPTGTTD